MGDSETYVTKVECLTQHRMMDQKINDEIENLRKETDVKIAAVYSRLNSLYNAGVALIVTSLISIVLTLFSMLMQMKN